MVKIKAEQNAAVSPTQVVVRESNFDRALKIGVMTVPVVSLLASHWKELAGFFFFHQIRKEVIGPEAGRKLLESFLKTFETSVTMESLLCSKLTDEGTEAFCQSTIYCDPAQKNKYALVQSCFKRINETIAEAFCSINNCTQGSKTCEIFPTISPYCDAPQEQPEDPSNYLPYVITIVALGVLIGAFYLSSKTSTPEQVKVAGFVVSEKNAASKSVPQEEQIPYDKLPDIFQHMEDQELNELYLDLNSSNVLVVKRSNIPRNPVEKDEINNAVIITDEYKYTLRVFNKNSF